MGNDLTGKKFGKLTVIKKSDQKRRSCALWECRCECGNTILLEPYKIKRELVKSCGCSRKNKHRLDLTGKRIGHLRVIKSLDEKQGSCYVWLCKCDCGKEIKVPTNRLSGKHPIQSCGCTRKKGQTNLEGKRFGKLTALEPTEKRKYGSVVWRCQCDCGNIVEVAANQLESGNTKSCGCLAHEKEDPTAYMNYIDSTCVEKIRSKKIRKDNESGFTGVRKQKGKWIAQINFQKVHYHLGSFETKEEAAKVRKKAEHLLHDGFVRYFDDWKKKAKEDPEWGKDHPLHVMVEGTNIEDFELIQA